MLRMLQPARYQLSCLIGQEDVEANYNPYVGVGIKGHQTPSVAAGKQRAAHQPRSRSYHDGCTYQNKFDLITSPSAARPNHELRHYSSTVKLLDFKLVS